jgi:predicted dehydrogenase
MLKDRMIRFGIIGCGTVTETAYLPYFKMKRSFKLTSLVDKDESRVQSLAKGLDLNYVGKNIESIYKYVDAVIVAVPNHLHFVIANRCLEAGKHVLCEKPLAITSDECSKLLSSAKRLNVKLAVAHIRRFYQAARIIKRIVDSRELGELMSFDFEEGTLFNWSTVTGYIFDKAKAGGGVLMDIGVHVLDLLLWWHPYEINSLNYEDDSLGGVEAYARLHIIFSNGTVGRVKVSRLSVLKNRYKLIFENGVVEVEPLVWDPLLLKKIYVTNFSERKKRVIKIKNESPVSNLLSDFVSSIRNDKTPLASGEDGLRTMNLIETCYQFRKMLPLEWLVKRENLSCNQA